MPLACEESTPHFLYMHLIHTALHTRLRVSIAGAQDTCSGIGVATYTASTAMAVPHFGPRSSHQLWYNSQVSSSVITDIKSMTGSYY